MGLPAAVWQWRTSDRVGSGETAALAKRRLGW
jgi:hypothetical protein